MYKIVLTRHGQSIYNARNLFAGWIDTGLTDRGIMQAQQGGQTLKEEGFSFDLVYTSRLKRAIKTTWLTLEQMDAEWLPVIKAWQLNERHYGGLQGLNKSEMAAKYGEEQVYIWRRSFNVRPPALTEDDPNYPIHDPRYTDVPKDQLPLTECLEDVMNRVVPYWNTEIAPQIQAGKKVLISAHGNSLRALIKYLDGVSDEEIAQLNIPYAIPLVYELDDDLRPIKHYYLADDETLAAAIQEIIDQGKIVPTSVK